MTLEEVKKKYPLSTFICERNEFTLGNKMYWQDAKDFLTKRPKNCTAFVINSENEWILIVIWYQFISGYGIIDDKAGVLLYDSESEKYEFIDPDEKDHLLFSNLDEIENLLNPYNDIYINWSQCEQFCPWRKELTD